MAFAVFQARPAQRHRDVHRGTGWWLAGAMALTAAWVPVFGQAWLVVAQLVIVADALALGVAFDRARRAGAAE